MEDSNGQLSGSDDKATPDAWQNDTDPTDDSDERRVAFAAIDSFHQYRANAHFNCTHRRRQNLYALPSSQWQLLAAPPISLLDTLSKIDDAIDSNADLAEAIASLAVSSFGLPTDVSAHTSPWYNTATANDHSKAHSTIRQFYRDWSAQGYEAEVRPIFNLIIAALATYLPRPTHTQQPTLLLPGAGLGCLLLQLSLSGYAVTGNEISYHQLFASNYILNHCPRANKHTIYPFATTSTNQPCRNTQLARSSIPHIHPATAIQNALAAGDVVGEMNMTAGDFILSYSGADSTATFQAVVTVYFIDTAPNLFRYIHTVHNVLQPRGIWINMGPLLWHFDDRHHPYQDQQSNPGDEDQEPPPPAPPNPHNQTKPIDDTGIADPGSFELSNDEVLQLVEKCGFEILHSEILPADFAGRAGHTNPGSYIQDPNSMLQNRYRCSHWVARKR